jgi:hypothetical protein
MAATGFSILLDRLRGTVYQAKRIKGEPGFYEITKHGLSFCFLTYDNGLWAATLNSRHEQPLSPSPMDAIRRFEHNLPQWRPQ